MQKKPLICSGESGSVIVSGTALISESHGIMSLGSLVRRWS